jgi:hypothetical protein
VLLDALDLALLRPIYCIICTVSAKTCADILRQLKVAAASLNSPSIEVVLEGLLLRLTAVRP